MSFLSFLEICRKARNGLSCEVPVHRGYSREQIDGHTDIYLLSKAVSFSVEASTSRSSMLFSTRALGDENKLVLSTAALEYVKQLKRFSECYDAKQTSFICARCFGSKWLGSWQKLLR